MSLKEEIKSRREKTLPTRVFSYIHGVGRIGVLVEIQAQTDFALRNELVEGFAHEVCLQIASMNPLVLTTCQGITLLTDPRAMAKLAITVKTEPEFKDKPELMEKIIEGKMAKWDKENVLLEQSWIKDKDLCIGDLLNELWQEMGEEISIVRFARFGS